MKLYLLTAAGAGAAAVVVAIVAATAAADAYASSSSSSSAGVFSSPCFLWAAANVIVLWLVSSYRGHPAAAAGDGVAEGGGGGDGVDMGLYTLSLGRRDDVLFAVPDVVADLVDAVAAAPVVVTTTAAVAAAKKKKKQPREERAAKRGTNHPRVRKASAGGVGANDELMRRAESLIRRHHEQLRLQRQESEQRQALELQRRRPLIRV
uniref:DUF4408 domain-containing protein n=1 Tax=Oryza brachyantha TaxID=4533 RepID=J3N3K9_ORYBR